MTLRDTLNAQAEAWNSRALLRRLYEEWFEEIGRRLATEPLAEGPAKNARPSRLQRVPDGVLHCL